MKETREPHQIVKPPVPPHAAAETPPWLQETHPIATQQEVQPNKPWNEPAGPPAGAPTDDPQYANKFVNSTRIFYTFNIYVLFCRDIPKMILYSRVANLVLR